MTLEQTDKQKIYWSRDFDDRVRDVSDNYFRIVAIPKRWWSIKEWKLGIDFIKNVRFWMIK